MVSRIRFSSCTSIWPGADALPAEANVIALPNRAPAVRVTAPSGPIAIVMIGSDGYKALTSAVASRRVNTSPVVLGITAIFGTSAKNSFIWRRRFTITSWLGVPWKSWLLMIIVMPCTLANSMVLSILSWSKKSSISIASTNPVGMMRSNMVK